MRVRMELLDPEGARLADMSTAEVTRFRKRRRSADELHFNLPFDDDRLSLVRMGETEISLYLADHVHPDFVGPIWNDVDEEGPHIDLVAKDIESYFDFRYIEDDLLYENVDQFMIAWNLIQHTQDQVDGDLRIEASFSNSGVSRTRRYHYDNHHHLRSSLNSFRNIINGFDWKWTYFSDGRREWTPYYPTLGTFKPHMSIEYGKNIHTYTRKRYGEMINDATATAGGDGPDKLTGRHIDASRRAAVGLRSIVFMGPIEAGTTDILDAKAQLRVEENAFVRQEIDITVKTVDDYNVLDIELGDTVPVNIERGRTVIQGEFTIEEIEIDPYKETARLDVARVDEEEE